MIYELKYTEYVINEINNQWKSIKNCLVWLKYI